MTTVPDLGLLRLAHVALRSADPDRLASYYQANVGLVPVAAGGDGVVRLTTDHHHHCLEVHPGEAPSLAHVAFEVRDLDRALATLNAAGDVSAQPTEALGYELAARFNDPEGNVICLVAGARGSDAISPGDRVFRPRKLGHIGMRANDLETLCRFYTEALGFRLSDWIGEQVVFLRCNPDHHALVFVAEACDGPSMHHIAFEVESWEGFAREADILAANGVRVAWGPGRHAPSRNYFMYFDDADGNRIEWIAGVRQIADDESHRPEVFDPVQPTTWNLWGVMPPPDFLNRIGPGSLAAV
jgi:catechol 2,3-dioxygenase